MRVNYIILIAFFLLSSAGAFSQAPQAVFFKALPPPMTQSYVLDDIALIGISNGRDIQLWDKNSKAYYGYIEVVPIGLDNSKIIHVEFLKEYNKIAVVWEEMKLSSDLSDTSYQDNLFMVDIDVLEYRSNKTFAGGGMGQLIKYKYGNKVILPELKDEKNIYQYYFNINTGKLYTIDRKGNVNIYLNTTLIKSFVTGVTKSEIICSTTDDRLFFVTDRSTNRLIIYSASTGLTENSYRLELIQDKKKYQNNWTPPPYQYSVASTADKNVICILDSVNRMRVIDIRNAKNVTYTYPNLSGFTIISFVPFKADFLYADGIAIAESQSPPYSRFAIYTDTKNGMTNIFSGGVAPLVSNTYSVGDGSKFRMIVSGMNEVEINVSNLTERPIAQFFSLSGEMALRFGSLENGSYQHMTDSNGRERIKVYKRDSLNTTLQYTQPIKLGTNEQLAGILPLKKWHLTFKKSANSSLVNKINFYDSVGNNIYTISTALPLQTLNLSGAGQHLFSNDGNYFMLKEITSQKGLFDSCRLRIFSTSKFNTVVDLVYTEYMGYNPSAKRTAVFADSSDGFYFISVKAGFNNNNYANYLSYYNLSTHVAKKQYETKLCLETLCNATAYIRHIRLNKAGTSLLWFGDIAPDTLNHQMAVQFIVVTNPKTGQHFGGMNIPLFPQVINAMVFSNYLGVQFTDHVKFIQPVSSGLNDFLTVIPYVNENTAELSTVFTTTDKLLQKLWYYERTNSDDCISFRVKNNSFRRRQFDIGYNRPDKILMQIPGYDTTFLGLYIKAVSKRGERIKNTLQTFKLDEIPILTLHETKLSSNNNFTISVKVKSTQAVKKFYININGNRTEKEVNIKGTNILPGYEPTWNFFEELTVGNNKIEITAVTESGFESFPLQLTQYQNSSNEKPALHLLAVSVGNYKNGFQQLPFALKDGRDIAKLFSNFGRDTLFDHIFIDTLYNEDALPSAISNWIESKRHVSPADHIVVFYSGHGFLDSNLNLRLGTTFTDVNSPALKSIEYEKILQAMDLLPARQKLLLIDACNSGDFDKSKIVDNKTPTQPLNSDVGLQKAKGIILIDKSGGFKSNSFEMMQNLFSFSEKGNGTVVISAAGGSQSAYENARFQNGYFTYALKEALIDGKATSDSFNRVWLNQLIKYLKQRVTEISKGQQVPNLRISNPDLNWRIR